MSDAIPVFISSHQASNGLSASTVIKAAPGRLGRVNVTTISGGTNGGSVYDAATTGAAAASNLIATLPKTVGSYEFDWPFNNGLVYIPGTSEVVSISWS